MLTRRRPRRLPFSPGLLRPIFEGNATVTNTDIPLRSSEDTVWSTYSDTPTLVESDRLTSPRTARVVMEHSERPVSYGIGGAGNLRMSIKLLLFIDRLAFRYPHFPLSLYLVSEHATICPSKLLPSFFKAPSKPPSKPLATSPARLLSKMHNNGPAIPGTQAHILGIRLPHPSCQSPASLSPIAIASRSPRFYAHRTMHIITLIHNSNTIHTNTFSPGRPSDRMNAEKELELIRTQTNTSGTYPQHSTTAVSSMH